MRERLKLKNIAVSCKGKPNEKFLLWVWIYSNEQPHILKNKPVTKPIDIFRFELLRINRFTKFVDNYMNVFSKFKKPHLEKIFVRYHLFKIYYQ